MRVHLAGRLLRSALSIRLAVLFLKSVWWECLCVFLWRPRWRPHSVLLLEGHDECDVEILYREACFYQKEGRAG